MDFSLSGGRSSTAYSNTNNNSDNVSSKFAKARQYFGEGDFVNAEQVLKQLNINDLQIQHNLAIVQFLNHSITRDTALKLLGSEVDNMLIADETRHINININSNNNNNNNNNNSISNINRDGETNENTCTVTPEMLLPYKGAECAVLNRAILYARSGLTHHALTVLRALLKINGGIVPEIRVRALCLFQAISGPVPMYNRSNCTTKLGMRPRSEEDENLIKSVLDQVEDVLQNNSSAIELAKVAFASSNSLQETFKTTADNESKSNWFNYNNLGVLSLHEGRPGVAALCFANAYNSAPEQLQQSIGYNYALCDLLRGDFNAAITTFATLTSMHNSPMYWLRYGEALLGVLQRMERKAHRAEYEHQQDEFIALLENGKTFSNFEFLLLPGAMAVSGPACNTFSSSSSASNSTVGLLNSYNTNSNMFGMNTSNSNSNNSNIVSGSGHGVGKAMSASSGSGLSSPVSAGVGKYNARYCNTETMTNTEKSAACVLQNALFLLIPEGSDFVSAMRDYPHHREMLQYAMLYWAALELHRKNYLITSLIGQQLLTLNDKYRLPATVHATLLSYMVDALVHLNDPEQAMNMLRQVFLPELLVCTLNDPLDAAQRSRVKALFVNLAVTHILTGSFNQAHRILDSLLQKMQDTEVTSTSLDFKPERDVVFAHHLLNVFLELAQGNQDKAKEWLQKLTWSLK